jgi:septal ring factor EnvC (AmiA/AmiB activator)
MNSEKMFMESRIKELRKENEVLNKQKQELKSSMRTERLELSKKYEREKEELAEKYRNELKSLRKNIAEKTVRKHIIVVCSSSGNLTRELCFLICPSSGRMGRKQSILVCPPSGNLALRIPAKVLLLETSNLIVSY